MSRRSRSACCGASATRPRARRPRGWPARRLPDVHVSTSHETAGVFREYERCATTIVDAALSPLLRRYLRAAGRALPASAGLPEPEVMLSSGGVAERRHGRAPRVVDRALGPGRRRGGRGPHVGERAGRGRRRAARHGRHLLRRVGGVRRPAPARPAGARWAAARWRCRWWTCTRSARAAAAWPGATPAARCGWGPRSAGADARPRVLRPRRRGAHGHRRQPAARLPRRRLAAGRRRGARPRGGRARAGARWATRSACPLEETAAGIVRVASAEMARRGARDDGRARHRPARPGAGRVRRRGAAARLRDRRASSTCGAWWSRGRRACSRRSG